MLQEFKFFLPEIIVSVSALLLLVVGVFRGNHSTLRLSLISVAVMGAALVVLANSHLNEISKSYFFSGMLVFDSFSVFVKALILASAILIMLISVDEMKHRNIKRFEYPILILLSVSGMMFAVSSADIISLYVAFELQSLSLYILAAFNKDDNKSNEAGLKYFVLGALASGLLLFGASYIYGFTGTTSFAEIAEYFTSRSSRGEPIPSGLVVGLVLVISGLLFKISAVPFHMWTPDVYNGAPTPVTAFFAAVPKIAALAILARLLYDPFIALSGSWKQIIIFASIASMLIGSLGAIKQENLKRMLAYSAIGHAGFVLVGVAAATGDGLSSLLIYITLYVVSSVVAFACVLLIKKDGVAIENISDLAGLSKSHPAVSFVMSAAMFSMAGIPPLAGFFAKFYVFMAALKADLLYLVVIGVLSSVIAAFYYLRIVKIIYIDEQAASQKLKTDLTPERRFVIYIMTAITLLYFVHPSLLVDLANMAVKSFSL